jgi:hypothetical protein
MLNKKLLDIHCALGLIEWDHWFHVIPNITYKNMFFLIHFFFIFMSIMEF